MPTGAGNSYRALFVLPGVGRVFFGYLLARVPVGIVGLSLLLLGQRTGGTPRAGMLVGAFSASLMVATPLLGRALDTFSPRRVLGLAAVVHCAALAFLASCFRGGGSPAVFLLLGAALAGASLPPVGPALRASLPSFVPEPLLTTAFTCEAIILETVYIAGPALVGGLGTRIGWLPLAVGCTSTVTGVAIMVTAPWPQRTANATGRTLWTPGPLTSRRVRRLLLTALLFFPAIAVPEVAVTAVAGQNHEPHLLGTIMAGSATASLAGGLLFGLRTWPGTVTGQLTLLSGWVATAAGLAAVLPGPWLIGAAVIAGGLAIAPALALFGRLAGLVAPPDRVAETNTWLSTTNNCGQAAMLPLAGVLAGYAGPSSAFLLGASLAATAAALLVLRRPFEDARAPIGSLTCPERPRMPLARAVTRQASVGTVPEPARFGDITDSDQLD